MFNITAIDRKYTGHKLTRRDRTIDISKASIFLSKSLTMWNVIKATGNVSSGCLILNLT
jgi:hypothetical protein